MNETLKYKLLSLCIMIRTRQRNESGSINSLIGTCAHIAAESFISDLNSLEQTDLQEILELICDSHKDNPKMILSVFGPDILGLSHTLQYVIKQDENEFPSAMELLG